MRSVRGQLRVRHVVTWLGTKEGSCFTWIADPQRLAWVADTLSQDAAIGRLGQACDRWIYSACLCFGLDLAEQARSGFRCSYSIYQAESSPRSSPASAAPAAGRKPAHWTRIDRDYETLRIGMQALFDDLGITPVAAAAA
jgi:hypothetical protein